MAYFAYFIIGILEIDLLVFTARVGCAIVQQMRSTG